MCVLSVSDQPISPRQHTLTNFINVAREGGWGEQSKNFIRTRDEKSMKKSFLRVKHFEKSFFPSVPMNVLSLFRLLRADGKEFPIEFVLFVNIFSAFRGQLWRCFIYDSRECFLCRSLSNEKYFLRGWKIYYSDFL